MKASIKFREEQNPLIRAKIPLNVLSLPFQSGVVAGESKELSLNLSTLFDAGPTFKFAYRPNDTKNPFSLICKTGIGHFGSPISSPFTMSAEFNFVGNQNPTFFIHFKPKFGDFAIKKSHSSSVLAKKIDPKLNGSVSTDGVGTTGYFEESGLFPRSGKINVLPMESAAAATSLMESVLSGARVKATTALPLKNHAVLSCRWGLRFPPASPADDEAGDAVIVAKNGRTTNGISFRRFPMLLMDKISIEHVVAKEKKIAKDTRKLPEKSDVSEAYLDMKKQLEIIQTENGLLRGALDDMMTLEFDTRKFSLTPGDGTVETGRYIENGHSKSSGSGRLGVVTEDLQKQLEKEQ